MYQALLRKIRSLATFVFLFKLKTPKREKRTFSKLVSYYVVPSQRSYLSQKQFYQGWQRCGRMGMGVPVIDIPLSWAIQPNKRRGTEANSPRKRKLRRDSVLRYRDRVKVNETPRACSLCPLLPFAFLRPIPLLTGSIPFYLSSVRLWIGAPCSHRARFFLSTAGVYAGHGVRVDSIPFWGSPEIRFLLGHRSTAPFHPACVQRDSERWVVSGLYSRGFSFYSSFLWILPFPGRVDFFEYFFLGFSDAPTSAIRRFVFGDERI